MNLLKYLMALFVLVLGQMSLSAKAQSVDDLHFYTEDYAPLNFAKDGKVTGITVDVLDEMLKRAGSRLTRDDIQLVPWARGYFFLQNRPNTVLFATTRTESRERLFHWVGPIVEANIVLIGKKSTDLTMNSLADLKGSKVAAVRNDVGHQLLVERGVDPGIIHVVNNPKNAVRLLRSDRAQYWAYGKIVALWYLNKFGEKGADYHIFHSLKKSHYYFAFSYKTDKTIINKLQQALDSMKQDGTLAAITNSYISN